MRWAVRVFGFIIMIVGFLFTITILGAPLGIPMMIAGSILALLSFFVGGSKTHITNVINVAGGPNPGPQNLQSLHTGSAMGPAIQSTESTKPLEQKVLAGRFCSECGAAVTDAGSAFCGQCGKSL